MNIGLYLNWMKPTRIMSASSFLFFSKHSYFLGNKTGMFFLVVVDDGYVICKKHVLTRARGIGRDDR